MPIALSREQRDAIRQDLAADLSGVGDIWIALSRGDHEGATRLRGRYETVMRLLDDLGWAPEHAGERFTITMPADQLAIALQRLGARSSDDLTTVLLAKSLAEEIQRHAAIMAVCAYLHEALTLGETADHPAHP